MNTITVRITEEDIENDYAAERSSQYPRLETCAIAQALKRELKVPVVQVGYYRKITVQGREYDCTEPLTMQSLIWACDEKSPKVPDATTLTFVRKDNP